MRRSVIVDTTRSGLLLRVRSVCFAPPARRWVLELILGFSDMALACTGTRMITFCSHRALHPRIRDPCGNVKAFCCKTCGRTRLACLDFRTLEAASVLMAQNRRSNGVLERSSVSGAFRNPPPILWAVGMIGVEIGANTANAMQASGAEPANHRANQSLETMQTGQK